MRPLRWVRSIATVIGFAAGPWTLVFGAAEAQLPGLAPYVRPAHDPGPTAFLLVNTGSVDSAAEIEIIGVRASIEGDRWRLGVGVARLESESESLDETIEESSASTGLEASLAYSLLDQNTHFWLPGVFVGLGTSRIGAGLGDGRVSWRQLDVPIGVTLGLNGRTPLPVFADFEPWVAARLHLRNAASSDSGVETGVASGVGLSAGLRLRLAAGVGVQSGLDWLRISDALSASADWEFTWSVGAHVGF